MARSKNPYRAYAAIVMASLLLICVLSLTACSGNAGTSTTSSTNTTTTSSSSQNTAAPADNATKIKNADQQVQDAVKSIDSTQNDVNTASQSSSDNDQTP